MIPRRFKIQENQPAEIAIREAIHRVEELGADVRLTDAVVKLDEALNHVSDYIDEQIKQQEQ